MLTPDLRVLAHRHPRASWPAHANLGHLARFWLQRHAMFRELDRMIRDGAEEALTRRTDLMTFRPWLARHLQFTLAQLEEHHAVEDHHYFPLFRRAEPRLVAGFDLLERDHEALHRTLEAVATRADDLLRQPAAAAGPDLMDALGRFHDAFAGLGRELARHLDDEEDLVIPVILEHGERKLELAL